MSAERAADRPLDQQSAEYIRTLLDRRFWSKVDRRGPTDCWPWRAAKLPYGYGAYRVISWTRNARAHRLVWQSIHGPIPPGAVVMHTCDNPPCVNPAHLRIGTQAENLADCAAKQRQSRGQRHGRARLTEAQAREILASTEATRALATRFSVGVGAILRIRNGMRWRHLLVADASKIATTQGATQVAA